jgi:hypothetical protein
MPDWESNTEKRDREDKELEADLSHIYIERQRRGRKVKIVALSVVGLIVLVVLIRTVPMPNFGARRALLVGDETRVGIVAMVAVDDDALADMIALQTADDQVGLNMFQSDGRAFTLNEGTLVLITDLRFNMVMVRTLEGPHTDKTGWVQSGRLLPVR